MTPVAADDPPVRGRFITFEGGDGAGKTTQIERLAQAMTAAGYRVVTTREPGGSPGADAIRHVVLSGAAEALGEEMEAILFAAARADHVASLIEPALRSGAFVLCDRFHDSTRVYQGAGRGVGSQFLSILEDATVGTTTPDLTIILDLPAEIGLERAAVRRGSESADRFEKEPLALHDARRRLFLDIAAREPERCVVVDATRTVPEVVSAVRDVMRERLDVSLHDGAATAEMRS